MKAKNNIEKAFDKSAIGLEKVFKSNKKTKTAKAVLEIDVFAKAKTKTSLRSFAFANYRSFLIF